MASRHEKDHLRIVLLGETGVGKSSAGNIILGREEFHTDMSPESVTTRCQKAIREFNGQTLAIIDTPGLFHTAKSHEEVVREIAGCITRISPGPHVFLLVLKHSSFTDQNQTCLETFQKVFKGAKCYTIVLFIHGDLCKKECDALMANDSFMKRFLGESCVAHHVIDIEGKDECQVNNLLQKINDTVQNNGGSCYSNELIREIEPVLKEVMQRPEVKTASDPVQAAVDLMSENIPEAAGALKVVTRYLNFLNKWLYKLMPAAAKE